jgi:hypothetical protein
MAVRRSNRVPTLYWWSLPLGPRDAGTVWRAELAGARAVVHPASALDSWRAGAAVRDWPGDTALVGDIAGLLAAREEGRVGACTMAFFPPTARDADLEPRMARFDADLERLPFTIAMRPDGDGPARHHYGLRVPGKIIAGLEHLALGRSFGGSPGQVEMALLQGLALRPGRAARLRLVMQGGGAVLLGIERGGRRRIQYLEAGKGYTGIATDLALGEALGERWREAVRRFPVGVVVLTGLPLFIAAFWLGSLFARRDAVSARDPARR